MCAQHLARRRVDHGWGATRRRAIPLDSPTISGRDGGHVGRDGCCRRLVAPLPAGSGRGDRARPRRGHRLRLGAVRGAPASRSAAATASTASCRSPLARLSADGVVARTALALLDAPELAFYARRGIDAPGVAPRGRCRGHRARRGRCGAANAGRRRALPARRRCVSVSDSSRLCERLHPEPGPCAHVAGP